MSRSLSVLLVLFVACNRNDGGSGDAPGVCINEIMADNDATLEVDGEYPDWIELYNPTDGLVSIAGWTISDDREEH